MAETSEAHRGYMLTINNPTEHDVQVLQEDKVRYRIWQFEVAPTTGTLHIQAFIYYKNKRVWPKKRYPTAHIEAVRSIDAAIKYCSKDETRHPDSLVYEDGDKPEKGRRTDLEAVAREVIEGKSMTNVAEEHPEQYVRYARGLQLLKHAVSKDRREKPRVIWLWGPTGVGKTRRVFDTHEDIYIKDGTQWWDGYTQNEVILIDDFDGRWPYRDLLRLLDRYPYQGQTKGAYVKINSPFIYITCEHPPIEMFEGGNHLDQVLRRIDEIVHMKDMA